MRRTEELRKENIQELSFAMASNMSQGIILQINN